MRIPQQVVDEVRLSQPQRVSVEHLVVVEVLVVVVDIVHDVGQGHGGPGIVLETYIHTYILTYTHIYIYIYYRRHRHHHYYYL